MRPCPAQRGRGALADPHIGPSTGRDLGTGPGDPKRRSSPALESEPSRGVRFENPCEKLGRDSEADTGGEGTDRRQDQVPRLGGHASLPAGPGSGTQGPALGPRRVLPGKDITPEMGGGPGGGRPRLPGWGLECVSRPKGPRAWLYPRQAFCQDHHPNGPQVSSPPLLQGNSRSCGHARGMQESPAKARV